MRRPALRVAILVVFALSLAACGGGGGGGAVVGVGSSLAITTTSLPSGTPNVAYPTTTLEASDAEGAVTWQLVSGALPAGLTLSSAGVVSGTPTAGVGTYDFTVEANDTITVATQPLSIILADFQASVTAGLTIGDAWTEQPLTITASGHVGNVSFVVDTNASGGALSGVDGVAGTATWTPGPTGGVTDVVDVTDLGSGSTVSVVIDVEPNPVVNHVARFGTTDVWYLAQDLKRGSHAYATDMHKALVDIGLWPAASTGPAADDFERLIEVLVRVTLLREINQIYLREADGAAGVDGLDISFPYLEPAAGSFTAPPEGSTLSGSAARYSIMELADQVGVGSGILGTAFVDMDNDRHEHNGGNTLGTFTDRVTGSFSSWQGSRELDANPVNPTDQPILEALLYEQPMSGARYDEIKTLLEFWARAMAIVTAHEIGHSLGLDHNSSPGTLMASSIGFSTSNLSAPNAVPLTTSEVTTLETDLPGPGKTSAPFTLFGSELPERGGETRVLRVANDG